MLGCGKEMFAVSVGRECLGWLREEGNELSGSDEIQTLHALNRPHRANTGLCTSWTWFSLTPRDKKKFYSHSRTAESVGPSGETLKTH